MEGRSLQVEGVQKAPEILVSRVLTKERRQRRRRRLRRRKVRWQAGPQKRWRRKQASTISEIRKKWSNWRSINQEGINIVRKNSRTNEEEVGEGQSGGELERSIQRKS